MGIWCYTKLETTGNPKAKNFQQLWHRLNIYSNRAYFRQLLKFSVVTKFGYFIEHWSIVALKFFKLNFFYPHSTYSACPMRQKILRIAKVSVTTSTWSKKSREKMKQLQNTRPLRLSGPPCRKAFQKIINIFLHPKDINESMNSFANFQIGYCCDTCETSSIFTGEIIAD